MSFSAATLLVTIKFKALCKHQNIQNGSKAIFGFSKRIFIRRNPLSGDQTGIYMYELNYAELISVRTHHYLTSLI